MPNSKQLNDHYASIITDLLREVLRIAKRLHETEHFNEVPAPEWLEPTRACVVDLRRAVSMWSKATHKDVRLR